MKKNFFAFIIVLSVILSLSVCFATQPQIVFNRVSTYRDDFSDVKTSDWYYDGVKSCFETGLMNGVSSKIFDTESVLSVAQGIAIATRIHSTINSRDILDVADSKKWYDKNIHYALDNGIILEDTFDNYERPIKSYEMVTVLYNALPSEYLKSINNVISIPDINSSLPYYNNVLAFYNAGILNGNDKYGTFLPESNISRKRAAVIISRITNEDLRLEFNLAPLSGYTLSQMQNIINSICLKSTSDDINVMFVDSTPISLSDLRYVYESSKNSTSTQILKETVINTLAKNIAIEKACNDSEVVMTPSEYNSFISSYYVLRYTFGENYKSILDTIGATDKAYLNSQLLYTLYSKHLGDKYDIGKELSPTYQEICNYANQYEYICAKNLFVDASAENAQDLAKTLLEKTKSGEDFDALIKEYGQDPGMGANPDGYVFGRGEMVKEFEDAAFALSIGEISEIIETTYGFHIIKRVDIPDKTGPQNQSYYNLYYACATQKAEKDLESIITNQTIVYSDAFDEIFAML